MNETVEQGAARADAIKSKLMLISKSMLKSIHKICETHGTSEVESNAEGITDFYNGFKTAVNSVEENSVEDLPS